MFEDFVQESQYCLQIASYFDAEISFAIVNISLNAIPIMISFRTIGRKFTLYSCLMIGLTALFTDIMPSYAITYDILLISIFGGTILFSRPHPGTFTTLLPAFITSLAKGIPRTASRC